MKSNEKSDRFLENVERGHLGPFFAPAWDIGSQKMVPDGRPLIMGIVNLTPDSFFAGSRNNDIERALETAQRLVDDGADILDLGAESSRPGAVRVGDTVEQERLLPVITAIRARTDIPITVDTIRANTARAALDAGADAINDISAGTSDPLMLTTAAKAKCGLILMHMQGQPKTMQDAPTYQDVVAEVSKWLDERCHAAKAAGVISDRLMVDPGIGFGKTLDHNLDLLAGLKNCAAGRPLLLGASRKRFIEHLTGAEVTDRLSGSLAALVAAWQAGSTMVRVHDVADSRQFLEILQAISNRRFSL